MAAITCAVWQANFSFVFFDVIRWNWFCWRRGINVDLLDYIVDCCFLFTVISFCSYRLSTTEQKISVIFKTIDFRVDVMFWTATLHEALFLISSTISWAEICNRSILRLLIGSHPVFSLDLYLVSWINTLQERSISSEQIEILAELFRTTMAHIVHQRLLLFYPNILLEARAYYFNWIQNQF